MSNANEKTLYVKKDTVYDQLSTSIDNICNEVKQLRLDKLQLLNDLNHVRTQLNLIEDAVKTIRNFPTILLPKINPSTGFDEVSLEDEIVKEESPFAANSTELCISTGDDDGHK